MKRTLPALFLSVFGLGIAGAGELPDPKLTPGEIDQEVTEADLKESICKAGQFSWTEGHMPPKSFLEQIEKEMLQQYSYSDVNLKHDLQRQLQHYIKQRIGFSADIINGTTSATSSSVNSRQKRIRSFQMKDGFGVIILSPLAVGFGVNIQAANHVIHYTRTWNPAKEDQATDRAYRIGQTRDVYVYYPVITADFVTFDMKLDRLLGWRRQLSDDMLNGCGDLSSSDFADLGAPEGGEVFEDNRLDVTDIASFDGKMFECLIAILLAKQDYPLVYRTPDQGDAGVDVVAIGDRQGLLVQCKTTMNSTSGLGWEAVKDVVAGTAFYQQKLTSIEDFVACRSSPLYQIELSVALAKPVMCGTLEWRTDDQGGRCSHGL